MISQYSVEFLLNLRVGMDLDTRVAPAQPCVLILESQEVSARVLESWAVGSTSEILSLLRGIAAAP